jgi:hypothetical protein
MGDVTGRNVLTITQSEHGGTFIPTNRRTRHQTSQQGSTLGTPGAPGPTLTPESQPQGMNIVYNVHHSSPPGPAHNIGTIQHDGSFNSGSTARSDHWSVHTETMNPFQPGRINDTANASSYEQNTGYQMQVRTISPRTSIG